MTSPYLLADLRRDEGLQRHAYQDTAGRWTIGYGHAAPDVRPGMVWSQEEAEDTLAADVGVTAMQLDRALPWWRDLDQFRRDALQNMAFSLGVEKLQTFTTFLACMKAGAFAHAALDLRATAWFGQGGARAERIAKQIATGQHQA